MKESLDQTDAQQREKPDPHERNRPIPWFVMAIIAAALGWSIYLILTSHYSDRPELGDNRSIAELTARAGGAAGVVDGAQIYAAQCVACHQATGAGLPAVFPPLAASEWVLAKAAVPIQILLHGISGSLTVKGVSYKGEMPDFHEKLGDAEIAAVLTHVRANFGNAADKIDVATVKQERAATKGRSTPWNGDEELNQLK